MVLRETVKLLSRGKCRSFGKLLSKAEGRGHQFPGAFLLTDGQLIDCSPRRHGISVLLHNLLYNFYKNNLFATLKSGECCLTKHPDHLNTGISQRYFKKATVHYEIGKQFNCFMIQKSETKFGKHLEITIYILYIRLGNKMQMFNTNRSILEKGVFISRMEISSS